MWRQTPQLVRDIAESDDAMLNPRWAWHADSTIPTSANTEDRMQVEPPQVRDIVAEGNSRWIHIAMEEMG